MKHETIHETKWLEIRRADGWYDYLHCRHGDGHGVAVLVYKPGTSQVLGRFEKTPCHQDEPKLCSLTGGVERGSPADTAVAELREEAGIITTVDKLMPLGQVWPSKASDTVMHLYALSWDGPVSENPEGDGSEGEKGAYVKWISIAEASQSKDPLIPTMLFRLMDGVDGMYMKDRSIEEEVA